MEAKDFGKHLENLSKSLIEALPAINEKVAVNAYALMRQRVIERGTIGEDKSLGTYSDNPLPAFYFAGKALNGKGEKAYEKAKKSGEGLSYAEWRSANNRPIDHVTLSFSGATLNDIGVIKELKEEKENPHKIITNQMPAQDISQVWEEIPDLTWEEELLELDLISRGLIKDPIIEILDAFEKDSLMYWQNQLKQAYDGQNWVEFKNKLLQYPDAGWTFFKYKIGYLAMLQSLMTITKQDEEKEMLATIVTTVNDSRYPAKFNRFKANCEKEALKIDHYRMPDIPVKNLQTKNLQTNRCSLM
jgi:hypothetical protein